MSFSRPCAECGRPVRYFTLCRRCKGGYPIRSLEDRFWPKVQKGPGCWIWVAGGDGPTAYGRVREGTKGTRHLLAHRVAWELTYGPIPEGMIVCHRCDTPRCVRPDHLFLGSYSDNMQDAARKGRMVSGDRWFEIHRGKRRHYGLPNTVANGRPRRTKPDPVTGAVRWAVLHRDRMCVLARYFPEHVCRDRWGNVHRPDDTKRLSIEHVKDELRMGVRAPSDLAHLVALCFGANVAVPSKVERQSMRDYLLGLPGAHDAHVDPCGPTCRAGVA